MLQKMDKKIFLSIVIPIYNEDKRIHNLSVVLNYIKSKKFKSELIAVNDGSTDNTIEKLKNLRKKEKFKILNYEKNKGKGYAIKKGVFEASGQFILFTDIDLSTPIKEFDKFIPFTKKYEIIIATRRVKGANLVVRQSFLRENLGRIFTFLSKIILDINVSDFTCGFKLFSKNAAKGIFSRLTIERWGFDSESLFIAKKRGFKIKEVGVYWKNDPLTKVKFPHDAFNSLIELAKIKINDLKGIYN